MTITAYEAQTRAEIARLLEELSPRNEIPEQSSITPIRECESTKEARAVQLKPCGARAFVKEVLMWSFGAGYDYAIQDLNGKPLKSWFTVEEAVEAAREKGYDISISQAARYLSDMAGKGYYEYEGGKYRRHFAFFRDIRFD